jgi:hypothetical protein
MDTPRRWQLASAVTALAGIGLGAVAMGRADDDTRVPSIELIVSAGTDGSVAGADDAPTTGDAAGGLQVLPDEPVGPDVPGDPPPDTAGAVDTSAPSVDDAPSTTIVAPAVVEDPAPDADSHGSPASVDSDDSTDSDD